MATQPAKFLNSWKEIAAYLHRGVRTVQRWEKIGLPVRRLHDGPRAPVVAAVHDIDRWVYSTQRRAPVDHGTSLLIAEALALREQSETLRRDGRLALRRLMLNISDLEKNCRVSVHQLAALQALRNAGGGQFGTTRSPEFHPSAVS